MYVCEVCSYSIRLISSCQGISILGVTLDDFLFLGRILLNWGWGWGGGGGGGLYYYGEGLGGGGGGEASLLGLIPACSHHSQTLTSVSCILVVWHLIERIQYGARESNRLLLAYIRGLS